MVCPYQKPARVDVDTGSLQFQVAFEACSYDCHLSASGRDAHVRAGHIGRASACCAGVGDRIKVLHSKIEDLDLHGEKVDILISEPMGTLLVNERMLETYVYARDHFLKPNGRMFPVSCLSYSLHNPPS